MPKPFQKLIEQQRELDHNALQLAKATIERMILTEKMQSERIAELEKAIGEAIYEIETNNAPNELRSTLRVSLKILRNVTK